MSTPNSTLTAEQAKALFSYDPDTGVLTRKSTTRQIFCTDSYGYVVVAVGPKRMKAHRVIWLIQTGNWPDALIDHINGIRDDNRWPNLRQATHAQNLQNIRKPSRQNKSGFLGVSIERNGKFRSEIRAGTIRQYLGTFETAEVAHARYVEAKRLLHSGCTI